MAWYWWLVIAGGLGLFAGLAVFVFGIVVLRDAGDIDTGPGDL